MLQGLTIRLIWSVKRKQRRMTEEGKKGNSCNKYTEKWLFEIIMIWEKAKVKIRIALELLIFLKELRFLLLLFSVDLWAKTVLFLPLA